MKDLRQILQRRVVWTPFVFLVLLIVCVYFAGSNNLIGRLQTSLQSSSHNKKLRTVSTLVQTFKNGSKELESLENLVQHLADDLQNILSLALPGDDLKILDTCSDQFSLKSSCDNSGCRQLTLPKSPKRRIEQLVKPPQFHLRDDYNKTLRDMGASVKGFYDIILVTGASSNHYRESMALIYNLKKFVLPYLKNFTFIYYDLGLNEIQRKEISNVCQCHVRDFPLSLFPKQISQLRCYGWKPMIINAHVSNCNIIHWMDASVRFVTNSTTIEQMYRLVRENGLFIQENRGSISARTLKSMFHFFGDEPCTYESYFENSASLMLFGNMPLIRRAILTPWAACALNESCMCPYTKVSISYVLPCRAKTKNEKYGLCHRFDQSAISIITRKIFQEKSPLVIKSDVTEYFYLSRGDTRLVHK